jgi:mannosyltransferase OCH1-like enzyme
VLIPRVFHQIWLGPDPLPREHATYQQTWLDHHAGWELRLWTEQNLPNPLRRPEAAEKLRAPAERADILRLELLWRFGGVYVDTDFECLRSIEPLIENASLFIGLAKSDRVNNALLGSVPDHHVLDAALDQLRPREFYGYDKEAAGPRLLDVVLAEHRDDVLYLQPETLYATGIEARRTAYAVHHEARSWKDNGLLRIDLQRAEDKMELALEKASRWRKRCKAAEAELDRLKRTWPHRLARLASRLAGRPRQ